MTHGHLIGRESEQAALEAVLVESLEGRGSLMLVAGEAGVGKTRFAEEVAESADAHLLRGACAPGGPAYAPVTSALRGFMRAVPGGLSGGLSGCGRSGGCATTCVATARSAS